MDFNFSQALIELGPLAGFRIINEARPGNEYLFETFLPEENKPTYHVEDAFITIRTTMAGLAGQSSPYPPSGAMEISTFLEKSAKVANEVALEEGALRQIQEILTRMALQAMGTGRTFDSTPQMVQEALNFYDKLVVQAHTDTAEWLRSQALRLGKVDWQYGDMHALVDYGVPASFLPAKYTGGDAFDQSGSKFWTAHYNALAALYYNVRAVIMHTTTWIKIRNNPANNMLVTEVQKGANGITTWSVQRWINRGATNLVASPDANDILQVITYDLEGEVLDPNNPGKTLRVPFMPDGQILYIANNANSGYRVGEGATRDPMRDLALGYTHLAPTVEGGGAMGRWGDMFVPQHQPWSLHARGVSNVLPVRRDTGPTLAKTYLVQTDLA